MFDVAMNTNDAIHFDLDFAATGAEVLEKLRVSDYGLILLDVGLPDTEPDALLLQIRALAGERVGVVMLSIFSESAVMEKCFRAGAAVYLVKPLQIQQIVRLWDFRENLSLKSPRVHAEDVKAMYEPRMMAYTPGASPQLRPTLLQSDNPSENAVFLPPRLPSLSNLCATTTPRSLTDSTSPSSSGILPNEPPPDAICRQQ